MERADINTSIYSDDTLLALEEVNAIYEILTKKYPGMPTVLLASMLTAVLQRIDSDKPLFTAVEKHHRDKRIWHPKYGYGVIQSMDENNKVIVRFDTQEASIKLSPKVLMLADDMDDQVGKAAVAAKAEAEAAATALKNTPDASTGG